MISQCFLGKQTLEGTESPCWELKQQRGHGADGIAQSSTATQSRVRNPPVNLGYTLQRHSLSAFSLVLGTSVL